MIDVFTPQMIFPDCLFKSNHTVDKRRFHFWFHDVLCGVQHTAEIDSAVCCTLRRQLCDWISWRNWNQIRKYFSLFIRGSDKCKSWKKNWRSKISWHTLYNYLKTVSQIVALIYFISYASRNYTTNFKNNSKNMLNNVFFIESA